MRFVIQRVTEATCEVDQKITGQITNGSGKRRAFYHIAGF